jgi:Domain of unknown function (DUF4265)
LKELTFALDVYDGWPPVAAEVIYCNENKNGYEILNPPFFLKGVSVGDILNVVKDGVNGQVFEWSYSLKSSNSTIWLMNSDSSICEITILKLNEIGCVTEYFFSFSLVAVSFPCTIPSEKIDHLVGEFEKQGFSVAFPSWRHEENA